MNSKVITVQIPADMYLAARRMATTADPNVLAAQLAEANTPTNLKALNARLLEAKRNRQAAELDWTHA